MLFSFPLTRVQVIITTYQTLSMDFFVPKDVDPSEEAQYLAKHGYVSAPFRPSESLTDCSGVLARSRFYRAIADEAQYIRNRSTKASLSLAHIRAKYRWMLTGTPVTNTLYVLWLVVLHAIDAPQCGYLRLVAFWALRALE